MARELSVLVACANQEDTLRELVDRTQRTFGYWGIDGEIVLVDDASTDGTGALAEDLAAVHANVVALRHDRPLGAAGCWRSALAQAAGRHVCTLVAGAGHQPEAIGRLHREMRAAGPDLVQGVRRPLGRPRPALPWWLGRGLDVLLRVAFGLRGTDVQSSLVLSTRRVLGELLADVDRLGALPSLLAASASARGYVIRQVDTVFEGSSSRNTPGTSGLAPLVARQAGDLGRAFVQLRLRRPHDAGLAAALAAADAEVAAACLPASGPAPAQAEPRHTQLDALRRSQWLPAETLRALQRQRLQELLRWAIEHTTHYRARLERIGLVDDEAPSLIDLGELPLLERATVREELYLGLLSTGHDPARMRRVRTAGPTGELLELFVDPTQIEVRAALAARHREWAGCRGGDRWARASLGAGRAPLGGLLRPRTSRRLDLSIDPSDCAAIDAELARLASLRPAVLEASAEALSLLASRLERVPGLRVGAVVSFGQTLAPELRARLERAFGVAVFDQYRTPELGPVAQECEAHAGLHVNGETHVVEVLRDGRAVADGENGEVVVTDLGSRGVPLIRYRTGDRAALRRERCVCGRASPRLVGLAGRPPVFVRGTGGRWVPGTLLARAVCAELTGVRRYQVVQEADGQVVVRVVRTPAFSVATERRLRHALGTTLGPGAPLDLVAVEWLAPDTVPFVSRLGPSGPLDEPAQPPFAR